MKKMTPREALYNICVVLGPVPQTNSDRNLSYEEKKLRDSVRALQNFIDYSEQSSNERLDIYNQMADSMRDSL